jgi:hypothetical protein
MEIFREGETRFLEIYLRCHTPLEWSSTIVFAATPMEIWFFPASNAECCDDIVTESVGGIYILSPFPKSISNLPNSD